MIKGKTPARGRLARPPRAAALAGLVAGATLLAACSGGSSHSSGASASQETAKTMNVFAQCMRGHGQPDFYYANPQSIASSSGPAFSVGQGYLVTGVNPRSPQFASAMAACKHLLPPGPRQVLTNQQLDGDLKFVTCMRAHGFAGYPEPDVRNGQLIQEPLPASIDTSSPEFQAAEKACGGT